MTPRPRIRRRRSSSRHGSAKATNPGRALAALATTFLLAILLAKGPLLLGATRLWAELPLFLVAATLLLIQGLRLLAKPLPDLPPRRADAIDLTVVVFALYAIVRGLESPYEYDARIEVMGLVACAGVFLTCRHGMANRRHCMALLYVLVAVGVFETVFGYYASNYPDWFPFGPAETAQLDFAPRWMGTYASPNQFAFLLVMAIGASLAQGSFSKLPWSVRIILLYLGLMMIVALMYSGSRGGWLALVAAIAGLVVMGIRNGTVKWWIPCSAALALLVVCGLLFSVSPVVTYRLSDAKKAVETAGPVGQIPVRVVQTMLETTGDHLLFGAGPGAGVFRHPKEGAGAVFIVRPEPAHNDYLMCLADYGLAGYGLAMFFLVAVTLKFLRPLWIDNRWQDRVLVAAGFSAWLALLVHSFFDFNLHVFANALLLSALTGLALGRIREEKEVHWSTLPLAPLGRSLGIALVAVSLLYAAEASRTWLSYNLYQKTLANEDVSAVINSIQDAGQALRYDPGNAPDLVLLGDLHQYHASLQKDAPARNDERQKALEAYQRALRANGPDAAIEARIGAVRDLMQQDVGR